MSHDITLQLVGLGLFGVMILALAFSNQIGSFIGKRQNKTIKNEATE